MSRIFKKVSLLLATSLFAATMVFTAVSASATVAYPSGGTWQYGTTQANGGGTVYSYYHHPSKLHGASVRNANGVFASDYLVSPGNTARAQTYAVAYQVDHAYYQTN